MWQYLLNFKSKLTGVAQWKLIAFASLALCVTGYLIWSHVRTPPPVAGAIIHPAPAVQAEKVPGPTLKVPLRIVPPVAVEKKFPQLGPIAPSKPVVDTAVIPRTDNGGATVSFANISTGEVSTVFIPAKAPWISLEARNYAGVAIGASTYDGAVGKAYYKRDVLQVKGVFLQVEADAIARPNAVDRGRVVEGVGWVNIEIRW